MFLQPEVAVTRPIKNGDGVYQGIDNHAIPWRVPHTFLRACGGIETRK